MEKKNLLKLSLNQFLHGIPKYQTLGLGIGGSPLLVLIYQIQILKHNFGKIIMYNTNAVLKIRELEMPKQT